MKPLLFLTLSFVLFSGGAAYTQTAPGGAYTYNVLHTFCKQSNCPDGSNPYSGLTLDSEGNLYGTTYYGGANQYGTVFKVDITGSETVLYSFCSVQNNLGFCTDGAYPQAGLIEDAGGNLYGTTSTGGANGTGAVFELDSAGHEKVLYSFCSINVTYCEDGSVPSSSLIEDSAGNLYGTTGGGGANNGGIIFKVDSSGQETVLYSFCSRANCTDGVDPVGVIEDAAGNLYGTTYGGGANNSGAVFKLSASGYSVLYSFCSLGGQSCTDGEYPLGNLIMDDLGDLYGTTSYGGAYSGGAIFRVNDAGQETLLYSFCAQDNCADGWTPMAGVTMDASGNLYGTTSSGGSVISGGVVFRLDNKGNETVLHDFCSPSACAGGGAVPYAGVIEDGFGNLYGTAFYFGSANDAGTVFELHAPTPASIATSTTLTSSANPSVLGQAVTFTATVKAASGPTPTGTVTFKHGASVIGTGTLSGGVAKLVYSGLAVGSHSITASYGGNATDAPSTSAALLQTVLSATTTKLASSPNPSVVNQAVTFTATVTASSGSTPTGTVTFKHGGTVIGTGTLSGGVATLVYSGLAAGDHSITASYNGSATDEASTSVALDQVVNASLIATTTALTSSPNPSTSGQAVTFKAVVTAASGATPAGTVTFKHGGTVIGTGTLSGGVATLVYSGLTAGSHSITATYGGNSTDATSTSSAVLQTVN